MFWFDCSPSSFSSSLATPLDVQIKKHVFLICSQFTPFARIELIVVPQIVTITDVTIWQLSKITDLFKDVVMMSDWEGDDFGYPAGFQLDHFVNMWIY